MKKLKVDFLSLTCDHPVTEISEALDNMPTHGIDITPWHEKEMVPDARFAIAHGSDSLFLKYHVTEYNPRVIYTNTNEPVYKDSCVEFFMAFENENAYYNFEFNILGNALVGYGTDGANRHLLPVHLIRKIRTQTTATMLRETGEGLVHWQLTVVIPLTLFMHHTISSLRGKICSVNFNKCGDDLSDPHFLTWSDIQAEQPDFHMRRFFGTLEFIDGKRTGSIKQL